MTNDQLNNEIAAGNANVLPPPAPVQQDPQTPGPDINEFLPLLQSLRLPRAGLASTPTTSPKNFVDQIQFGSDGSLYIHVGSTWYKISAGGVAGPDTSVQVNNAGAPAGYADFTWDEVGKTLGVGDGVADVTLLAALGTPTLWLENDGNNIILKGSGFSFLGGGARQAWFNTGSIAAATSRTYNLPNNNGTIALESAVPLIDSGTVAPTSTPGKVGDVYLDTSAKKIYFATGTSSSADWTVVN